MSTYIVYVDEDSWPFSRVTDGVVYYAGKTIEDALIRTDRFTTPIKIPTKKSIADFFCSIYHIDNVEVYEFTTIKNFKSNYPELFI